MKIVQALRSEEFTNIRVSHGDRWLVWDVEWVVYERKYGAKKTKEIVRTPSEDDAVAALMK